MMARLATLAERLEREIQPLSRAKTAAVQDWTCGEQGGPDSAAFINSAALHLHSLYSGLERLFELIAIELDEGPMGGSDWYAQLLDQLALNVPGHRPAVLREETRRQLDELRKFRHLVRNIYTEQLDPDRMRPVATKVDRLWSNTEHDIKSFAAWLRTTAGADDEPA